MADPTEKRRPIKVVTITKEDRKTPEAGRFSDPKNFVPVDRELRSLWIEEVYGVEKAFQKSFQLFDVAGVAKVTLRDEALAKSYRPTQILNPRTCPIIGVRGFGELLVSVSPEGLRRLRKKIDSVKSKQGVADLSTIKAIEPYSVEDAVGDEEDLEELEEASADEEGLKIRLFHHHDKDLDRSILETFQRVCRKAGVKQVEPLPYSSRMSFFRVRDLPPSGVEALSGYVGLQSFSAFPEFEFVRASATPIHSVEESNFPGPEPGVEYPVIGMIDGGTAKDDPFLKPWVVKRRSHLADSDWDPSHGSFVAGLAIHGRRLNNDQRFPGEPVRLVDVAALPRKGTLSEPHLIQAIQQALRKCPEVRYWNLSLNNTARCCDDDTFSDLAKVLDELQDEHNVTFVVPVGNPDPTEHWYRPWPADGQLGERDRICSPADSVRAVSVASIAHQDRPDWQVKRGEPSPFSRRGPGPSALPKPELGHYGGNCDRRGSYSQTGVRSLDGRGNVAEDIGTSFATPLVTNVLANIHSRLHDNPNRTLVRALALHSAAFRGDKIDPEELRYRGFGIPGDIDDILYSTPWAATLIIESSVAPRTVVEKHPFPIPSCLRTADNRVRAGFLLSLVYDPPLNPDGGVEYCQTNLDASLRPYDIDPMTGKAKQASRIPPDPKDLGKGFEKERIELGFKWSPVKLYRKVFPKGVQGDQWRLQVSALHRAEYQAPAGWEQPFSLVVTVFDPDRARPVNDEMIAAMIQSGWQTQDLQVDQRVQVRT